MLYVHVLHVCTCTYDVFCVCGLLQTHIQIEGERERERERGKQKEEGEGGLVNK